MGPPPGAPRSKSVLWNFKFAGTAVAGSLTCALVSAFAPPPAEIAFLGSTVSILAGLFVAFVEQEDVRERSREELLATLRVPLELAREPDIFEHYLAFSNSLIALSAIRERNASPSEPCGSLTASSKKLAHRESVFR
jgi:hypothetical protein